MTTPRFLRDMLQGFRRKFQSGATVPDAVTPVPVREVVAFDYADARIPDVSRGYIDKVLALIAEIEAKAAADVVWSPMLIEIHQLSEVHLPALVKSYIEIPASHRAEIFRKTGRSASFLLNDGLKQMLAKLRAMSRSQAQGNIDAFTTAMRFVDMRYGANDFSPD